MRDLTSFIEAALASEQGKMFWFLELQFNTVLRYTDCDIDLWGVNSFYSLLTEGSDLLITEGEAYLITEQGYESNKFETMPFTLSTVNYSAKSSVDSVELEIGNVDLQMSAVFLNEDILNKWGVLKIGFFDSDNQIIHQAFKIFEGLVSTWTLSEPKASITLVNEFILWNKKTLRKYQSACRWSFKSTECGYSGTETWCDQGYARCTALGNVDNFSGFRWLPDLMEKQIYWGRSGS
jgi:hypothetical protein